MICTDGGRGLLTALPRVYPNVAVQRCWAHKVRNVVNKIKKTDQPAVKASLQAIMNAPTLQRPAPRPTASPSAENARLCVPPMPSNADSASSADEPYLWASSRIVPPMDRILFTVFAHENKSQGLPTLFPRHKPFDVTVR